MPLYGADFPPLARQWCNPLPGMSARHASVTLQHREDAVDMWGVELAVMAGMIALNSVFAAYEIALASVTRAQLQVLRNQRRTGSSLAFHMKDNMEASLAVVQLGITLVRAVAAAVGGA